MDWMRSGENVYVCPAKQKQRRNLGRIYGYGHKDMDKKSAPIYMDTKIYPIDMGTKI